MASSVTEVGLGKGKASCSAMFGYSCHWESNMPIFYPQNHKITFPLDYDATQVELSKAQSSIKSVCMFFLPICSDGPVPKPRQADSGPRGLSAGYIPGQ